MKLIFLLLNQNICCGYSKEPSQRDGSFEHKNTGLKLVGKKILTISHSNILFILTYGMGKSNFQSLDFLCNMLVAALGQKMEHQPVAATLNTSYIA